MRIVVVVPAMSVKGDFTSEQIIMEDTAKAIKEMNMLGLIFENTGIPVESIEEIMLLPEFTEIGDGSQIVVHESGSRKSKAMLVKIDVFIPFAGDIAWDLHEKIGEGFKGMFKGRFFNISIRNNDERLHMSIKPPEQT